MKFHHRSSIKKQKPFKGSSKRKLKTHGRRIAKPQVKKTKTLITKSQKKNFLKQTKNLPKGKSQKSVAAKTGHRNFLIIPISQNFPFPVISSNYENTFISSPSLNNKENIFPLPIPPEQILDNLPSENSFYALPPNFSIDFFIDAINIADSIILSFPSSLLMSPKIAEEKMSDGKLEKLLLVLANQIQSTLAKIYVHFQNDNSINSNKSDKRKKALAQNGKKLQTIFSSRLRIKKIDFLLGETFDQILSELFHNKGKGKNLKKNLQSRNDWRKETAHFLATETLLHNNNTATFKGIVRGNWNLRDIDRVNINGFLDSFEILNINSDENGVYNIDNKSKTKMNDKSDLDEDILMESNSENDELKNQENLKKKLFVTPNEFSTKIELERLKFDFPEEVETPTNMPARLRFHKYKGITSLKNSFWPQTSVPKYYKNLISPQSNISPSNSLQNSPQSNNLNFNPNLIIRNGHPISLTIKIPSHLSPSLKSLSSRLFIISAISANEKFFSVAHLRIQMRWSNKNFNETQSPLKSKAKIIACIGLRKFVIRPLLSREIKDSNKNITCGFECGQKNPIIVSAIIPCAQHKFSANLPIILLDSEKNSVLGVGKFDCFDTEKVLLKKIILTGYPTRCKKNTAVVRYMFFHPKDVKYFSSVELRTRKGLSGSIKESVGLSGYAKCVFSGNVTSDDIVCMSLYKRRFPLPYLIQ